MELKLSDKEAAILLGATLMHWGVPFRMTAKRQLSAEDQAALDQASEKLTDLREEFLVSDPASDIAVELSSRELLLLAEVGSECLAECRNDPVELEIQLKSGNSVEIESLIAQLRARAGKEQSSLLAQ